MRTIAVILLLALFVACAVIVWLARPRRQAAATPGTYRWMWERR